MQALLDAAEIRDVAQLRQCINTTADLDARDRGGITALILAARNGKIECVRLLVAANGDIRYIR